jgi:hypothetical protein
MTVEGVVTNGRVEIEAPKEWPDGTRVEVTVVENGIEDIDIGPKPLTETYEEYLDSLREAVAEIKAGVKGMSLDEVRAAIDAEIDKVAAAR